MKKTLAILNFISVIFLIGVNYVAEALKFNDTTVAELSRKYDNLFTPSSYAFAIWILIFLGLFAYCFYQIRNAFFRPEKADHIEQTEYWFFIANILTGCWVLAFVYEYTGISVLIMLGILFSLIKVILNTNMEKWDAPIGTIVFVWWPICIYAGWISVATIANISVFLTKINWNGFGLSEVVWTIAIIIVATIINLLMILRRNMREFAMVGAWALIAIYVRHNGDYNSIAYTALTGAILLIIAAGIHGYQNRTTSPVNKLKERFNN